MIKRVLLAIVAVSAIATAAGVAVIAAAFALYAALVVDLGPPGAAAVVAAVAALLVGVGGAVAAMRARTRPAPPQGSLLDRVTHLAMERPALAAAGAVVAGLIALKNPKFIAGLVSAFIAGKAADRSETRRRW